MMPGGAERRTCGASARSRGYLSERLVRRAPLLRRRRRTGFDAETGGIAAAGCRVGTHKLISPQAPKTKAAAAEPSASAFALILFGAAALCGPPRRGMRVWAPAGITVGGVTLGGGAVRSARGSGVAAGITG